MEIVKDTFFYSVTQKRDRYGDLVTKLIPKVSRIVTASIGTFVLWVSLLFGGCPYYNVWQQAMTGKAKLAEAEYSRKIAIAEADAKLKSADLIGQSRITMATAEAEANRILGDSLKNNNGYLQYLWIEGLKSHNSQIIYVPTEAGLPMLEAGHRPATEQPE